MANPALLTRLFGGGSSPADPTLRRSAENQALVRAGVTLAGHRGPGALLAALEAGQQGYRGTMEARRAEEEMARIEEARRARESIQSLLLESAQDPGSLLAAARQAAALGDIDSAKLVLDLAKAEAALKAERRTQVVGSEKVGFKLIDLATGETLADVFGPLDDGGRDISALLQDTLRLQSEYRNTIAAQGFDTDPLFIKQLRDVTPLALAGNSEAQEAFFRALLRIQNPDMRRVSDDAVFAQAEQTGLLTGRLAEDISRLLKGTLPSSVIQNWLGTVNEIIRGRINLFDQQRRRFADQAAEFGLNPRRVAFDYFAAVRAASVPGADPDVVGTFESELTKELLKRRP